MTLSSADRPTRPLLAWVACAALGLLPSCQGLTPAARSGPPSSQPSVVLVLPPAGSAESRLSTEVTQALARRDKLLVVHSAGSEAAARGAAQALADDIRTALGRARSNYLAMRMATVRLELQRALDLARRSLARALSPRELAELHLYLAAVSHAERRFKEFDEHCQAAVSYDPTLTPDADVFSPPVRAAFESARGKRQPLDLVVQSEPTGATIIWDGVPRGTAPLKIAQQGKGEHFLLVEHPLYETWGETILLNTNAQLQVRLEPRKAAEMARTLREHPALAERGMALLGINRLLWQTETARGVELEAVDASGRIHKFSIARGTPPALIEQTAHAAIPEGDVARPAAAPESTSTQSTGMQSSSIQSTSAQSTSAQSTSAQSTSAQSTSAQSTSAQSTSAWSTSAQSMTTQPDPAHQRSYWRRYWWAWTLAGAAIVTTAIVLPLSVGKDEPGGRGAVLKLPEW